MLSLLTATWMHYWRQPLQGLLALLGIALGVAAISAMDSVHHQASRAHQHSLRTLYGPATHVIRARQGGALPEQTYATLRRTNGNIPLAPVVSGPLRVQNQSLELVGVDPFAAAELGQFAQLGASPLLAVDERGADITRLLVQPQAVAMGADTARRLGVQPGQRFRANIAGRWHELELGFTWHSAGWADGWVLADIARAQEWLGRVGELDRILVAPRRAAQLAVLSEALPARVQLAPVDDHRATQRMSQAFYTNLRAMGLLAWLLGIFLAYNAYALMSRQRWREFADWRTLGVTPGELSAVLVLDAALLGLAGGVAGVWLGRELAQAVLPLITQVGANFYGGAIAVKRVPDVPWPLLLLGPLAAWGAVLPLLAAIRRQRAAPLKQALDQPQQHRRRVWRAAAAGAAALITAAVLRETLADSVTLGFSVLFLLFMGYALLLPLLMRGLLACYPGGVRLAPALLRQHLNRQGVAQAAFVIALAAGLGIGVMIQGFRDSVVTWLDQVLWANWYLSVPNGATVSPLHAGVLHQIAAMPEVARAGGVRSTRLQRSDGGWLNVNAYALEATTVQRFPLLPGALDSAYARWLQGKGVFVNESLARLQGFSVGDEVVVQGPRGEVSLLILAVNVDYSADEGALVMAWPHYRQRFDDPYLDAIGVDFTDADFASDHSSVGAPAPFQARVAQLLPPDAALRWISQRGIHQRSLDVFDQTFSVTRAGRVLILLIALVAVAGAMTAMVMAQRPWLGTLRALGVPPAGLMGVVLEQGMILGLLAAVLAVPLGLCVSWILAHDIMRNSFGWLLPVAVSWPQLAAVLGQAWGVVMVASLYPAWRWRRENLRRGDGE